MSWARFGWDDAYMYPSCDLGYYCQSCHLMPTRWVPELRLKSFVLPAGDAPTSFATWDPDEFIAHVAEHRAAGDDIPPDVEDGVREWAAENPDYAKAPK